MSEVKIGRNPVFPWRYAVPRPRYFRLAAVARKVPEIRAHIDREARYILVEHLLMVPAIVMIVLAAPLMLLGALGLLMTQVFRGPDYSEKRFENARLANSIVPPLEVARRMGDDVPVILPRGTPDA